MYIVVVLPFVDMRALQTGGPKRLTLPTWPDAARAVQPEVEVFQKYLGKTVEQAPKNHLPEWVREHSACVIRKSVRLKPNIEDINIYNITKDLYFDGYARGYFSFSFKFHECDELEFVRLEDFVRKILNIKVYCRHFERLGEPDGVALSRAGSALVKVFSRGSYQFGGGSLSDAEWNPLVRVDFPLVFCRSTKFSRSADASAYSKHRYNSVRLYQRELPIGQANKARLMAFSLPSAKTDFDMRRVMNVTRHFYLEALFSNFSWILMAGENVDFKLLSDTTKNEFTKELNESLKHIAQDQGWVKDLFYRLDAQEKRNFMQFYGAERIKRLKDSIEEIRNRLKLPASSDSNGRTGDTRIMGISAGLILEALIELEKFILSHNFDIDLTSLYEYIFAARGAIVEENVKIALDFIIMIVDFCIKHNIDVPSILALISSWF